MPPILFAIIVILAGILLWAISTQRKLVALDENAGNAMVQIGVQLSGRFDALTALLNLTKGYSIDLSETLIDEVKSGRNAITAISAPDDVLRQEGIISDTLFRLSAITEKHPEFTADQNYKKIIGAVETFENMLRTSRLIYNDSVTKLNREIRMFPVSMIAGMLGFRKREYLVEQTDKADKK